MLVVSLSPREVKYIVVHNMYDSGYGVEVEDKAGSIIYSLLAKPRSFPLDVLPRD